MDNEKRDVPEIRNYMEDFVRGRMDSFFMKLDVCHCEVCRLDVMAMVLNELPTKYVVTNHGAVFTKVSLLEQQYEVDLIRAVTRAAEIVNSKPRHD